MCLDFLFFGRVYSLLSDAWLTQWPFTEFYTSLLDFQFFHLHFCSFTTVPPFLSSLSAFPLNTLQAFQVLSSDYYFISCWLLHFCYNFLVPQLTFYLCLCVVFSVLLVLCLSSEMSQDCDPACQWSGLNITDKLEGGLQFDRNKVSYKCLSVSSVSLSLTRMSRIYIYSLSYGQIDSSQGCRFCLTKLIFTSDFAWQ
jgi:hypothetical protein